MEAAWAQEIIIDPNGNVGMTRVQRHAPAPVVDIARPNSGGVSHNRYERFDTTAQGAVLNNSASSTNTQVAGQVAGNPNLDGGTATTIVNEVTSAHASDLRGQIEVAGDRANVIVANPNGVSCDGCGFTNVGAGTLTTGLPKIEGARVELDVTRGTVTIGRGGLNGAETGVSGINLVGRLVVIDGKVTAVDSINVQGGAQIYSLNDRKRLSIKPGASAPGTDYAIDATAFGAMEAGRIQVVGNEVGLGVRMKGALQTTNGGIVLSAHRDIELSSATATGSFRAHAKSGKVRLEHDITAQDGNVVLWGGRGVTLEDRSGIYGNTGVYLNGFNGDVIADGDIQSGAGIDLRTKKNLQFSAYAVADEAAVFAIAGDAEIKGATIVAKTFDGTDLGSATTIQDSAIFSLNDVRLRTTRLNYGKDVVIDALNDTATSRLIAEVADDFHNSSNLRDNDTVQITLTGNLHNEIGGVLPWRVVSLSGTSYVHNSGVLHDDDSLTFNGAGFVNDKTGAVLSKAITITSSGEIVNKGTIASETDLRLVAGTLLTNDGLVQAAQSWWNAQNITNGGDGDLRVSGSAVLSAENTLLNQGAMNVLGAVALTAKNLTNNGLMITEGTLKATGETVTNAGTMVSATLLHLTGENALTNSGTSNGRKLVMP